MRRRLFNLALITSLLLCNAIVALWVRSYFASDILIWGNRENVNEYAMGLGRGGVCCARVWPSTKGSEGHWSFNYMHDPPLDRYPSTAWPFGFPGHNAFGFGWAYESNYDVGNTKTPAAVVIFPHALPLVLTGTFSTCLLMRWRRTRRKAKRFLAGLCAQCGYDIRATPNRCPECGHIQTPHISAPKT